MARRKRPPGNERRWRVLSRIQHGRTGAYHEPGEVVELGHLSAEERADLVAKQIIEEVHEHGADDRGD